MINAGTKRRLVLKLQPADAGQLARVLQDDCRVDSYQLGHGGRLQLQYDLERTCYRRIRSVLDATGIRARCRFCDALASPLLGLVEDNLQQQRRHVVPWAMVLHAAYVAFRPNSQTRSRGVHNWHRHLRDDEVEPG